MKRLIFVITAFLYASTFNCFAFTAEQLQREAEIQAMKELAFPIASVFALNEAFIYHPELVQKEATTIGFQHNLNDVKNRVSESSNNIMKVYKGDDQENETMDLLIHTIIRKKCQKHGINLNNVKSIGEFADPTKSSKTLNEDIKKFIRCALKSFTFEEVNNLDEFFAMLAYMM